MNIFVAKLDRNIGDDELRGYFEQYGEVKSAKVIYDRETGYSKWFGFVEMNDEEQGTTAIENLNGYEINGRQMVVKQAEDRPQRSSR